MKVNSNHITIIRQKKHEEWKINRLFYLCGRLNFIDSFQFFQKKMYFLLSIWKHSFHTHTTHWIWLEFYFGSTQFSRVNEKKALLCRENFIDKKSSRFALRTLLFKFGNEAKFHLDCLILLFWIPSSAEIRINWKPNFSAFPCTIKRENHCMCTDQHFNSQIYNSPKDLFHFISNSKQSEHFTETHGKQKIKRIFPLVYFIVRKRI